MTGGRFGPSTAASVMATYKDKENHHHEIKSFSLIAPGCLCGETGQNLTTTVRFGRLLPTSPDFARGLVDSRNFHKKKWRVAYLAGDDASVSGPLVPHPLAGPRGLGNRMIGIMIEPLTSLDATTNWSAPDGMPCGVFVVDEICKVNMPLGLIRREVNAIKFDSIPTQEVTHLQGSRAAVAHIPGTVFKGQTEVSPATQPGPPGNSEKGNLNGFNVERQSVAPT